MRPAKRAVLNKRDTTTRTSLSPLQIAPRGLVGKTARQPGLVHDRFAPPSTLSHVLEHIWYVAWDVEQPLNQKVVAHPSFHLVFESDYQSWRIHGPRAQLFKKTTQGVGFALGLKLRPGVATRLVSRPHLWKNKDAEAPEELGLPTVPPLLFADPTHVVADSPELLRLVTECLNTQSHALTYDEMLTQRAVVAARTQDLNSASDLAQAVGISLRKLQRLFRTHVGLTPKNILNIYRLHEALEDLKTGVPLAEIAAGLGYADQAHFTRAFRKVVGQTPGDVQQVKQNEQGEP